MTSINFNAAANSALRTLQSTNSALDATQNRISTGLKIGEAKDNAAYWSISTTLKSDNKAMATVKDALSLGAATVDTAYQGLNATLDVLNDIKSKLVAASQDGVDKSAIQSEITELQKQLKSIATSSTFSGENWLSVDSSSGLVTEKQIVSSFTRNADGAVSIDTVKVDTSSFVLIDANTAAEGMLDAGKIGNVAVNGLDAWTASSNTPASGALVSVDVANYTAADGNLIGKVTVSGTDYNFNIAVDTTANTADTIDTLRAAILAGAVNSAGQALSSVAVGGANGTLDFRSTATGSAQTISVNISTANSGIAAGETVGDDGVDQSRSTVSNAFGATAIEIDRNDTIAMSVTVNGTAKNFSVTRSAVDAALGAAADGTIANAQQYASVINKAIEQAGIVGITATADGAVAGSKVTLTAKGATTLVAAAATANMGTSILNINVTNADKAALTNFINAVSDAANSVTSAAATLGAVGSRIDLQKTFVSNLMDTIEKGVSGLVDADMNEESTKLQALQVKQQLGVQALSIANQSAQNVLSLFRS